jgi:hypothetical protein
MTTILAIVLIHFLSQSAAPAVAPAASQITFSFENAQLDPSSYTLTFREDGAGHYQSKPGPASNEGVAPAPLDRDIKINDPLLAGFFRTARAHGFFAVTCQAPSGHIAFTGKKTVSYSGPDGHGECTYNWSRDAQLNQLASDLMAVADTLEEGRRLTIQHQHSRLSLDAELEALQDAVKDRRALEIGNISSELQSIADDEAVMNRARNRARALLNGDASSH